MIALPTSKDSFIINSLFRSFYRVVLQGRLYCDISVLIISPFFAAYLLDLLAMEKQDENFGSEGCSDKSSLVSEDGKNTKSVVCQRCGSKVLCPGMGVFAEKRVR